MIRTHGISTGQIMINARAFRKRMTPTEEALWNRLRRNALGVHFRRQHPIGEYIADFYCREAKLVVEIDGGYHRRREVAKRDRLRDLALRDHGLRVLHITNDEVTADIDAVVDKIRGALGKR